MLDPDRAVDELNRVALQPGVRGVYRVTKIDGHDLDDPMFEPILARIEALDLPIFLHPLQTIGGKRLGVFYLNNFLGNPIRHGDRGRPPTSCSEACSIAIPNSKSIYRTPAASCQS